MNNSNLDTLFLILKTGLNNRPFITRVKAVLIAVFSASLIGASEIAFSSEVHEAHTHGVANLTLAFESGALEVQFESPAISLWGFEHRPKTQEQIEAIHNAKEIFSSSTKVMSINGAKCSPEIANVDILGPAGEGLENHSKHEDDHQHSEPEQKHNDHDHSSVSHSELSATYTFDCADGEQIQSVHILVFNHFSGLEKINVNWVTETQQGESILSSTSSIFELK